jgi:hypothetical protein
MWNSLKGINNTVTSLLSKEAYLKYKTLMSVLDMPYEVVSENAEQIFQEQDGSMQFNSLHKRTNNIVGRYARYSEIMNYIDDLAAENPDLVSSYVTGQTYEKRNIKVVVLKTKSSKRNVWIDCGIHAVNRINIFSSLIFN